MWDRYCRACVGMSNNNRKPSKVFPSTCVQLLWSSVHYFTWHVPIFKAFVSRSDCLSIMPHPMGYKNKSSKQRAALERIGKYIEWQQSFTNLYSRVSRPWYVYNSWIFYDTMLKCGTIVRLCRIFETINGGYTISCRSRMCVATMP